MPTTEAIQTAARGYAALAEDLALHDRYAELYAALEQLTPRERFVVEYRWGLADDGSLHTLDETGEALGLSKERARQIERKAFEQLRRDLGSLRRVLAAA